MKSRQEKLNGMMPIEKRETACFSFLFFCPRTLQPSAYAKLIAIKGVILLASFALNHGFETGDLSPWIGQNASVTSGNAHQGMFKAVLEGDGKNSFIYQWVPAIAGEIGEMFVSLAKSDSRPSPYVTATIQYYSPAFEFLGYGAIDLIDIDSLPHADLHRWKTLYTYSSSLPTNTKWALVVLNALPLSGSSDVYLDTTIIKFNYA